MITVKLLQVVNCIPALNELVTYKMPAKISYSIAKATKVINDELPLYEKTRTAKAEEYASKDADGKPIIEDNQYKFEAAALKAYSTELESLLNQTFDIQIDKISIDALGDAEIQPQQFLVLDWLFE